MIGVAVVLGYLLAHPGWLVAYVCVSAVTTVALLYYTIDDGHGRHALSAEDTATIEWARELGDEARELHHEGDEWWLEEKPGGVVPAFLPAPEVPPGYRLRLPVDVRAHTWVPDAPPEGVLEPTPANEVVRELTTVLMKEHLRARAAKELTEAGMTAVPISTYRPDPGVLSEYPPPAPPGPRTIRLPESSRVHLPPVTGWAAAILTAFTVPVRAHLAAAEQAEREAFQAEALSVFPEWPKWAGDDTLTSMRAIKAGAQ